MIQQLDLALVRLLSGGLSDILPKPEQVGICLPNDPGQVSLGIYLYNIVTCTDVNVPSIMYKGRNVQSMPPKFLSLHYLFTAYSKADAAFRALEDHRILTRTMQVLEQTSVLTMLELGFPPGQYIDALQVQMLDLPHEEMSHIWQFKETPPRLSVAYRICPVELPRLSSRMITRVTDTDFSGGQK